MGRGVDALLFEEAAEAAEDLSIHGGGDAAG